MEFNRQNQLDHLRRQTKSPVKSPTTYRGPESPLYSAICPFVYIFRIFGIAPYEFADDVLVPSYINSVFSLIWLCLYSYIIYCILSGFYYVDRGSAILEHTETGKTVFNYIVVMINITMSLWSSRDFTKVWNRIQKHDVMLHDLGYSRSERKTLIFVWSSLVISFTLWTAISRVGMLAFDQPWSENIEYMIVYVGTSVSIIKFSGIALLLGDRFSQLNEIAKTNLPIRPRWINVIPIVDTRTIERLHDNLMVAGEILEFYSFLLLIWIANLSFHCVFNLYIVISWIMAGEFYWLSISCLIIWTVAFLSQMVLLICSCHYASYQAEAMSYIMLSWRRWLYTRDRGMMLETSLHLKNRKLNFSAGGCFNVNLPLLRTIAAVMTTYLVILLQFD